MAKNYSKKNKNNKMDMNYLLRSRNVLYVVLLFAIANLFSYLMMKQLDAVAFFIIIGFLTSYFSKNMIVIMFTSMISTFLLVQVNMLGNVQEGMEVKEESEAIKTPDEHAESKANAIGNANGSNDTAPSDPVSTSEIPMTQEARTNLTKIKEPLQNKPTEGNNNNKEKFSQKLSPARYNSGEDDGVSIANKKPNVDYASTLETAYDNLDKLLTSDAMKNMSEDTNRLAEKQQLLMGNISKMDPIMKKAASILDGMDMGKIEGILGKLGSFGIGGGGGKSDKGKASVDMSE